MFKKVEAVFYNYTGSPGKAHQNASIKQVIGGMAKRKNDYIQHIDYPHPLSNKDAVNIVTILLASLYETRGSINAGLESICRGSGVDIDILKDIGDSIWKALGNPSYISYYIKKEETQDTESMVITITTEKSATVFEIKDAKEDRERSIYQLVTYMFRYRKKLSNAQGNSNPIHGICINLKQGMQHIRLSNKKLSYASW